jgi:hypothetical protein
MTFNPFAEVLPIPRPKAAEEIVQRWVAQYYEPRRFDERKLWADHFASVADYYDHKRRHPYSHAGAMTNLYRWTPYIIGIASIVTFNPIGIIVGFADLERRAWRIGICRIRS